MFSVRNRRRRKTKRPVQRPTQDPSALAKRRFSRLLILLAFVVIVATLTQGRTLTADRDQNADELTGYAKETIIADYYFETIDIKATEELRDSQAAKVPKTYRVDREAVRNQMDLVRQRVQNLVAKREALTAQIREALKNSTSAQPAEQVVSNAVLAFAENLKTDPANEAYPSPEQLAPWLMPTMDSVPKREFAQAPDTSAEPQPVKALIESETGELRLRWADELGTLSLDALDYVLSYGVARAASTESMGPAGVRILRERTVGDQRVSAEVPTADVPTLERGRQMLAERVQQSVAGLTELQTLPAEERQKLANAAVAMAQPAVVETLRMDEVVTAANREQAREAVEPVMRSYEPDQLIISEGSKWTDQARSDVQTYWAMLEREQEQVVNVFGRILSNVILVGLILVALVRSAPFLISHDEDYYAKLHAALLLTAAALVVARVISYFDPTGFSVPVAAVAILIAVLSNPRFATFIGVLCALLVSIQYGYAWNVFVVGAAMSLAGVYSIYKVRRRSDLTRAAVQATVVGVVALAAINLATGTVFSEPSLQRLALVLLHGGVCLFVVPGLLSPLERLFGITTDIQLLEYSDLNNELLSRLAIEVPATYSHSLMLGQLAEAAADAVGANGLKARVCAYYHDIGKMRRPEYFSENQTGFNIHEELSPRLSARAIASHVTEGAEMAREHHLPKPIIDAIYEHHGTMLISFFYQEAVKQQKHGDVREEDFRYGGPKPQSKETAILMICDAVESGVRSIKNPNEDRVREFIEKIVDARAEDGQLDECELNLKELATISDVIAKRMSANLHTRVAYPEKPSNFPAAKNVIPLQGSANE